MKLRSFSIAALMFFVAVAAIDANLLRQIDLERQRGDLSAAGTRYGEHTRFRTPPARLPSSKNALLTGFEIAGTVADLAYLACFRWWPDYAVELWGRPGDRESRPAGCMHRMVHGCFYQQCGMSIRGI